MCGSGRLGSSCHVWKLSTEIASKSVWVSRYFQRNSTKTFISKRLNQGCDEVATFMVILFEPAQCQLTARGFHDGPGANASTERPDVRVQPTGTSDEAGPRVALGPEEFRSIFSETHTRSKK